MLEGEMSPLTYQLFTRVRGCAPVDRERLSRGLERNRGQSAADEREVRLSVRTRWLSAA